MTSTAEQSNPATRTVERALGLLAVVCDEGSISLSDSARSAGLAPSTALRLLRTLESGGFVRRDPDGLFHAGPRIIQIGATALGRQELVKAAEPALHRIVKASGETSYLSIRGAGERALYIGMVEGVHAVRHTGWVGRTIPLDGTAAGAVLLGAVPDCGYMIVRSSVEPDVSSVAAPITWPGGVVGALSVVGPTYRIDEERAEVFGRIVSEEARALSGQFTTPSRRARDGGESR
ncbi:MAG: IclR family transcriptional regulator [Catenulispora sp.]|nr:IclR family transcriptional regulator [Catenulispora sp.]